MISFFKKNTNTKQRPACRQAGMTYIELIVVLGIFSVLLSVSLYNYKKFQAKVDVKNLANDVALKLVESQKSSSSGKWNSGAGSTWKPSYGVYFNTTFTPTKFVYFADLDNSTSCNDPGCNPPSYNIAGEVLDIINITKGNSIPLTGLQVYGTGCSSPVSVTSLSVVFSRLSSSPTITSTPPSGCVISYVAINVTSPQAVTATIELYPSGRIQIN